MAKVISVNISEQKGTIKKPVESITVAPDSGVLGDAHAGPGLRQISMLANESIEKMRKFARDLKPGDFAENITTEGITLHTLNTGTKMRRGSAVLEVTQIGKQCHSGCEIAKKTGACIMPQEGIFVRAINKCEIYPGDEITILNK